MAVITRIRSGLGNQLFCYAAGRALAHRLGGNLILDCRRADRLVYLDQYAVNGEFLFKGSSSIRDRYSKLQRRYGTLAAEIHRMFPRTTRVEGHVFRVFEERQLFKYERDFGSLAGSVYLNGYWQSFRYFEDVSPILRAELQPKGDLTGLNKRWLENIRARPNSVCVHVRRGDYLNTAFGLCSPAYYKNAAAVIRDRLGSDATFFVFSDDLPWCRNHLPISDAVFVEGNENDPVSELFLMAACRHHIIANSTFSWWAAWLGHHDQQLVIAPDPWISIVSSCPDLMPSPWIKLAR
jgi:hypothetical protein